MSFSQIHVPFQRSLMCGRSRKSSKHNDKPGEVFKNTSDPNGGQFFMDTLWRETRQLMERSEQLVHLITHVCSQKLSGVFRTESCPRPLSCCSFRGCEGDQSRTNAQQSNGSVSEDLEFRSAIKELESGRRSVPSYRDSCGSNISDSSEVCRKPNFNWTQCHTNSSWRLLSDGARGSGAGPPISRISKRKHSSPSAPSWTKPSIRPSVKTSIIAFLLLVASVARVAESCSSRSTPKPRPASPTLRPNVTFQTYACPPAYAAWFCLNGATCFTVKIQDAILYNCECAEGYMGPRCEFKDLDGSYLPARERVLLETASIAGGACIAIVLVFFVLFAMYILVHKDREKRRYRRPPN